MVVTFERDRGNRSMDKRFRCKARSVKYTARLERESWREGGALIQPADLKGDFSGLRVAANRRCAPVIGLHPPIAPRYFLPFHDCYVPTIHPIDRARSIDSNWLTDILSAKLANFKLAGWTRSSGRNISPNLDQTWPNMEISIGRNRDATMSSMIHVSEEETFLNLSVPATRKKRGIVDITVFEFNSRSQIPSRLLISADDFNTCLYTWTTWFANAVTLAQTSLSILTAGLGTILNIISHARAHVCMYNIHHDEINDGTGKGVLIIRTNTRAIFFVKEFGSK